MLQEMHLVLLIFISITIALGTDHIVMSLQVKSNRNVLSYKVVSDSFDWRTKGVVTPVKDYSESPHVAGVVMVETIESLHAIATGNLQRGSVARVIDCCAKNILSYECIRQMGGICTYDDYPTVRNNCVVNACKPFASFDTVDGFREKNDSALLSLIQKSTLLVGIDASQKSFSDYADGIYKDENCSQTVATHALQLIGYGDTENGEPYWIARNSWGQDWGENGYIRILRGENICGIGSQVYQPVISTMTTTSSRASEFYFSLNKCLFVVALCYLLFKIFYL